MVDRTFGSSLFVVAVAAAIVIRVFVAIQVFVVLLAEVVGKTIALVLS